VTVPNR